MAIVDSSKFDVFRVLLTVVTTLVFAISSFFLGFALANRDRIESMEKDILEVKTAAGYSSKNYELLKTDILAQLRELRAEVKELSGSVAGLDKRVMLLNNK